MKAEKKTTLAKMGLVLCCHVMSILDLMSWEVFIKTPIQEPCEQNQSKQPCSDSWHVTQTVCEGNHPRHIHKITYQTNNVFFQKHDYFQGIYFWTENCQTFYVILFLEIFTLATVQNIFRRLKTFWSV